MRSQRRALRLTPGARLLLHTRRQEWQTGMEMQTAGLRLGQGQSPPATPGRVGSGWAWDPLRCRRQRCRHAARQGVLVHSAALAHVDTGQLSRRGTQVSHWAHSHV